jgi:hypothetical protein
MDAQFKIRVDLPNIADRIQGTVNAALLPRLNQAVGAVAQQAMIDWKESVARARLWSGEKAPYVDSIQWKMTGDFSAEVWSEYKYAYEIDNGRPARDLKKMLDTSQKVRRTKDGKRFLIIPFRHNTPGNDAHATPMPDSVWQLAAAMSGSRITGTGRRAAGEITDLNPTSGMTPLKSETRKSPYLMNLRTQKPVTVASRQYLWGDRLSNRAMKDAGIGLADRRRYKGMVRMDTTSPSGAKSSAYLTFRTMMEGSSGWIVQAKPGLNLVSGVTQRLQPLAEKAFTEAVKRDLS